MAGQQQQRTYEAKGLAVQGAEVALRDALFEAKGKFIEATGGEIAPFMRECEFAMQLFRRNDFTADVARKNPASLRDALIQSALTGISLDPTKAHAYLVPRGGAIYFDPSYRGLRDAAIEDGLILRCKSEIVYENDDFEVEETDDDQRIVHHKYKALGDRGGITGAYCKWTTPDGRRDCVFETIEEIYDVHRSRSEAWKRGETGIWKTDEPEAIRKSLIKRAHKSWPRPLGPSARFDLAVAAAIQAEGSTGTLHDISETIDEKRAGELAERARPNVAKWCEFYKVEALTQLTPKDAEDMTRRLDSAQKRQQDEKARTQRKDEKKKEPAAPADQQSDDSIDLDALWHEIDGDLMAITDGDTEQCGKVAQEIRNELKFGTRDLTPAEVVKFRDAVKARVNLAS